MTLIEPGGFSTDWAGPSAKHSEENSAYAAGPRGLRNRGTASERGDPRPRARRMLKVVDAEQPPLRVFFGKAPLGIATRDYESRLALWNEWQPVALEAQG